ncbi:PREDICTED: uncharacterized protein LOC108367274 [Rhagoletis zephyria]|uniref:uncharacterized protein LOC108367274 n=1 Tax=Rhagoletis zephyria TaxID=28612 RepID=UPI000811877F|nr:PREDICTED: uncharacterized protein LOC108367274 [Rhagoletis zephyria]
MDTTSARPLLAIYNEPPATEVESSSFATNLLTLDNPVFCCFLFWASILVMKMLLMSLLTALQRFRHKTFQISFYVPVAVAVDFASLFLRFATIKITIATIIFNAVTS